MFWLYSLEDWELRYEEAGMLVSQGPVGPVGERAKAHVGGAGWCATLSTANALCMGWKQAASVLKGPDVMVGFDASQLLP